MHRIAALIVLITVGASCFASEWKWTTDVIDPNGGLFTSIEADKAGNLHLSYASSMIVKYGFLPAGSKKWFLMDLARGAVYTRLNLDPEERPHICFTGNGELHHLWFDGKNWHAERVAANTPSIQFSCSVGAGPNGTVHMAWYPLPIEGAGGVVLHIRYGVKTDNVWYLRTLDFGGESGKWNALEVDDKGNPHLSYSSFRNKEFRYATTLNNEWKFASVDQKASQDSEFPVGIGNDLALAPDGTPRLTYEDSVTVRYAEPGPNDTWKTEIVDQISPRHSWQDYRTRLTFDSDGVPHIVYQDAGALKHAWKDAKGWHIEYIDRSGADPYRYGSIAAGPKNTLYVVYRTSQDGALVVAKGTRDSSGEGTTAEDAGASVSPANETSKGENPAIAAVPVVKQPAQKNSKPKSSTTRKR